jgi:hypothetical protein
LDVALLQSGKFKEALDGLDKWLSEMEELVANQKPPSADYKVVKGNNIYSILYFLYFL